MKYSWTEYYRKAYEEEKKKNTALAGKVADAEAKREELRGKYAAICANPLYKAAQIPVLFKKGFGKVRRMGSTLRHSSGGGEVPETFFHDYEERLLEQRDRYERWISEEEPALWERYQKAVACLGTPASGEDVVSGKVPASEKGAGRRRCQVISYRQLAGITDLAALMEDAAMPEILLLADYPEELDERAVSYVEEWFGAFPDTKLLYGAEDHISKGKRCFPWFKPCWSPDTLLGFFYPGSYFAVDAAWAGRTSLSGYEDARLNLYDFVLRLTGPYFVKPKSAVYDKDIIWQTAFYFEEEKELEGMQHSPEIVCLELVLYHRYSTADFEMPASLEYYLDTGRMREEANPEFWGYEKKFIKLKQDLINSVGYESFSCQTCHPEVWSVVPECRKNAKENNFLITCVILSKDHPELLQNCICSFLERTVLSELQSQVEFIVADNGSNEENRQTIQGFLESLNAETHYIYHPMAFNFSAMCNMGVRMAKGEYVLLLNDDVEIIEGNWLRILLGQAMLPGTGAVGAKLWYPGDERIQHAGVTNMHIGPSHKLTTFPDDSTYYYGHNTVSCDMLAVTAACLLVKRAVYEEAGGLDEEMAVAYNDVDFCFKLARAGYRNVQRNDAVLLHYESASRGMDELSEEKWHRLIQEKTNLYKKHPLFHKFDPYYSEQLAGDASDYRIGYQYPYERLLLTVVPGKKERKDDLQKVLSGAVMLTVDRAGKQHKIYLEEPDILEMEGWCYMLGQDNCLFERWLILEAEKGDFYYQVPVRERLRPDVEAILPQQKNIALSGFTGRVLREDIIPENYVVGMLYRNLESGRLFYNRSDKYIGLA